MNARALALLALSVTTATAARANGPASPAQNALPDSRSLRPEPPPQIPIELPPALEQPASEGPLLSLADALERARQVSTDLAIAAERVIQADDAVAKAYRAFRPTLTGNASYTRNSQQQGYEYLDPTTEMAGFLYTQKTNALAASLDANWQFFNARAFPALANTKDQRAVSEFSQAQVRRDLLLSVCQTYLSAVQQQQLMLAAFRRSAVARDQAHQAIARYEAGLLQRASVMKAKLDVVNADEEAQRDVFALRDTKSSLATLLDRHDIAFDLASPPDPAPAVSGEAHELLQRALDSRPEMAAQLLQEKITARVRTDAWAQFFPTLSLDGRAQTSNADQFPGYSAASWAVTLAISIPLYDGGFRYVQLKDADSQERMALAQTRAERIKIEDELRRALLDLDSARALRSEAEQSLEVAQENERLTRAQFDAGTATQIEVSDAEANLFLSEAQLLQQKLNVQLSALQLARAVGAFDPTVSQGN